MGAIGLARSVQATPHGWQIPVGLGAFAAIAVVIAVRRFLLGPDRQLRHRRLASGLFILLIIATLAAVAYAGWLLSQLAYGYPAYLQPPPPWHLQPRTPLLDGQMTFALALGALSGFLIPGKLKYLLAGSDVMQVTGRHRLQPPAS